MWAAVGKLNSVPARPRTVVFRSLFQSVIFYDAMNFFFGKLSEDRTESRRIKSREAEANIKNEQV